MHEYYTLPLDFAKIMKGKEVPKCNLHQSIAQRIHIILVTRCGECRYDPAFGCPVWDNDFENVPNLNQWKDKLGHSISDIIISNEKRLERVSVRIDIAQEEFSSDSDNKIKRIKRRLDIAVQGFVKQTNEAYFFKESIYVSPMWVD